MEHCYTTTWLSTHQQPVTNYGVCNTTLVRADNVQHVIFLFTLTSIFARRPVKDTITACLPDGFERIVFNVTTALVMYVMFLLWEPLPHVIWDITIPWLRYTVIG